MQLTHFGALIIISWVQPKASTFNTVVSNALKIFKDYKDELETHGHSPQSGSKGEACPVPEYHKDLYKTYVDIHSGATAVITQSEKNHSIQKKVIGSSPPIGPETQACARSSSNATNKKNGHATVERNKRLPGALLLASSEENSDSSGSGKQNKKGNKRTKTSPQSTIEKHTAASTSITNAVVSLLDNMESGNKKEQDVPDMLDIKQSEMNLKKNQFEHAKDIEQKKFDFCVTKFEYKMRSKEVERDHTREKAALDLLKIRLDEAKETYRNETDPYLKEMAKEDTVMARKMYIEALTNVSAAVASARNEKNNVHP